MWRRSPGLTPRAARTFAGRIRAPLDGLHAARRGEFRVIYKIDDEQIVVLIVTIEHRRSVYRS